MDTLEAQALEQHHEPLHLRGIAVRLAGQAAVAAESGKIRNDDAVTMGELPIVVDPVVLLAEDAVQQDHHLALATLQIAHLMRTHTHRSFRGPGDLAVQFHQRQFPLRRSPVKSCHGAGQHRGGKGDHAFKLQNGISPATQHSLGSPLRGRGDQAVIEGDHPGVIFDRDALVGAVKTRQVTLGGTHR